MTERIPAKDYAKIARKKNKYGAHGFKDADGVYWASKWEHARYGELLLLEKAGVIRNLSRQVSFLLVVNGAKICEYRADAVYIENDRNIAEDAKGMLSPTYKLKAKLFRALFKNWELREVYRDGKKSIK